MREDGPAPARNCGDCGLCCKLLGIAEINKQPGAAQCLKVSTGWGPVPGGEATPLGAGMSRAVWFKLG